MKEGYGTLPPVQLGARRNYEPCRIRAGGRPL